MEIKNFIRKSIPKRFKDFINRTPDSIYQNLPSYSISGEDLVLYSYLKHIKNGFFIDVGAHHPFRFSNTFLLYKLGWRGINIDPLPNVMELFNKYRRDDINLNIGISESGEQLNYYMYDEPAFNTFSDEVYQKHKAHGRNTINIIKRETRRLSHIINENIQGRRVDLLCVDVEGYDLEVLKTLDWDKQKPYLIIVEQNNVNCIDLSKDPLLQYLLALDYELISIVSNNYILRIS